MLTLIHGDDTQKSREFYVSQKQKYHSVVTLEGEKMTLTQLIEAAEGSGLFSTTDLVCIELLFNKKREKGEFDSMIAYLNKKGQYSPEICIWEQKQLEKRQIGQVPHAKIFVFSFPQTLFQFLDALKPGNGRLLLPLFHTTLQTEAVELLIFMLTKQIRLLLALQKDANEHIEEIKRLQPWQKGKLVQQAKLFSLTDLLSMYERIYQMDIGYKTGTLSLPLTTTLDFFLSGI